MPAFHQSNIQHVWNLMDILYLYDTLIHTSWLRYIRRSPLWFTLYWKGRLWCEYEDQYFLWVFFQPHHPDGTTSINVGSKKYKFTFFALRNGVD